MGTFFELGKDKAAKGEGWAPPFISCAQDSGTLTPLRLRLLPLGKLYLLIWSPELQLPILFSVLSFSH